MTIEDFQVLSFGWIPLWLCQHAPPDLRLDSMRHQSQDSIYHFQAQLCFFLKLGYILQVGPKASTFSRHSTQSLNREQLYRGSLEHFKASPLFLICKYEKYKKCKRSLLIQIMTLEGRSFPFTFIFSCVLCIISEKFIFIHWVCFFPILNVFRNTLFSKREEITQFSRLPGEGICEPKSGRTTLV